MGMKTVLCYGDSNTWGYTPGAEESFGRDIGWPALLDVALGEAVHVAEEGLCGRTATWEDQTWDNRNGRTFFPVALETHAPIDLVVIMLGTNELKSAFNLSAAEPPAGSERTCREFRSTRERTSSAPRSASARTSQQALAWHPAAEQWLLPV